MVDNPLMPTKDRARPRARVSSQGGRATTSAPARGIPSVVTTDGVLALQQTVGNAAVQRALAVQRDDLVPGPNPVVGLRRGDGLDFGRTGKQPQVKLLQSKLNEKVGSDLTVDGKWGKKTSASLESFQLSQSTVPAEIVDQVTGDALMGGGGGGGGGGGVVVVVARRRPTWASCSSTRRWRPALMPSAKGTATCSIARVRPSASSATILVTPRRTSPAWWATWSSGAPTSSSTTPSAGAPRRCASSLHLVAESTTKAALAALPNVIAENAQGQVVDNAVTKPFTAAVDKGKEVVRSTVAPSTSAASIADFVDVQHAAQTSSHRDAVRQFHTSKSGLRQFTDDDVKVLSSQPIPGIVDPRLDRVQAVLDGVDASVQVAKAKTYKQVASSWGTVNARRGLREHGSFRTDVTEVGQLQDAPTTTSVLGVLEAEITFHPTNGRTPVGVRSLRIAGLSTKVRAEISEVVKGAPGPLIGDLGFPVRAKGSAGGGVFGIGSTDIAVAAPEDRSQPEMVNKGNNSALAYYAQKGGGSDGDQLAMFRGIAKVISEVDAIRVQEVTAGLQGP